MIYYEDDIPWGAGRLYIMFNDNKCSLSRAEKSVVQLLLVGYSQKQIATIHQRSIKTISLQKTNAFRRLNVRNDASLLSVLLLRGIVTVYIEENKPFRRAMGKSV
ncbi:helix-turn-helix transcriptional regulator [Salmonella enterica]|nr:helix-turn-helix transcriptional regulator [Salmonella enterica]ECX8200789.1 helix-turn-helix transcriptional regulator [Salmonella enterica]ELE6317854.1 helix-turn-helix transcriptional regulator [Salmonella enterica]